LSSTVTAILRRAAEGERLSFEEGVTLFRGASLLDLGRAAQSVCQRLHPEPYRTYNIDRNINYTNVCAAVCDFCAFYRKVDDAEAYVLDRDVLLDKIRETVALGGDQILLQGGLHPHLKLEWYEEMLRDFRAHFPQVNVHGFSAPEIYHFTKVSKLPLKTVLQRLKEAGLGSLPGGGAEILVDRVRRDITRGKVMTDDWIEVHRVWHESI
jgi:cyclic dehypoxanthinyl futalosine synthase